MQKIVYAVGGLVAVLIVIGLFLPQTVHVAVTETINAHPATVFAQVNDFRRVRLWSPMADVDPTANFVFSGPARGVGATMAWTGRTIGVGSQLITESRPFTRVTTVVNPDGPGAAASWFDLAAHNGGTRVTWHFEVDNGWNLAARYFGSIFAGIVEREYRAGLSNLAALAESLPNADFASLAVEHTLVAAQEVAYQTVTSAPDSTAVGAALAAAYAQIVRFMDQHDLAQAGAPLSIGRSLAGSKLVFDAAIPVAGTGDDTPRDASAVRLRHTYAGPAVRVTHRGSYAELSTTHEKIGAYLAAHGITRAGPAWESYVGDPALVAEADLETDIYYPVRNAPGSRFN